MAAPPGSLPTAVKDIMKDFDMDEGFTLISPRKRRTNSLGKGDSNKRINNRKSPPATPGTSVQNRFSALSDTDDSTTDEEEEEERPVKSKNQRKSPPPIILSGKPDNHTRLTEYLKKNAQRGFHIKYSMNNVTVYVHDHKERKDIISDLARKQKPFFTYTASTEKTHGYVIRGLDNAPEPSELLDELKLIGVNAHQVYRMKTVARPLYLIVTSADITLNKLNSEYKYIFHTRITWERHINKKSITQCHKCQQWGHATSNCYMPPVCLKCAAPHLTSECTKPLDVPATCANCAQDHPANSTTCAVYKRKLEERVSRQHRTNQRTQLHNPPSNKTSYVDAPPPARNVWADRAAAAHSTNVAQPCATSLTTSHAPNSFRTFTNQTPHFTPQQPLNVTHTHIPANQQKDVNNITELLQQIQILSTKINIEGIILALKDLNAKLDSATDQASKFMTFINFTQDINKYNI